MEKPTERKMEKSGVMDLVSIMNNPRHDDELTLPGPDYEGTDYEGPDALAPKKAPET